VAHSFSGSLDQARRLVDLGFLLGVGGPVTYPRARRLRAVVAEMPLETLLLETDAPDQPLCGHQGQRNEPARVAEVLAVVAELRDEDPEEVARVTSANAAGLFGAD
jgi:TatD DNase family protein